MRLINTTTLKQHEFFESQLPKYAILSHTWGSDEVSLKRFSEDVDQYGPGWEKILNCCRVAKTAGLDWAWCDTCCIDKTSSAELSEAINSMYRWYQQAEVCYALIEDFENDMSVSALSDCRWFTRGWTLQELLAPRAFQFYEKHWASFGTRESLANEVESITGIDSSMLRGEVSLLTYSTAQRMFWASNRQTTRPEDAAYCLMGVFDVNLPLLYGEGGRKAFGRLQRQIITSRRDDTIYIWQSEVTQLRGMLAESPSEFSSSRRVFRDRWPGSTPPIVTDQTVVLRVANLNNLLPWLFPGVTRSFVVPLACHTYTDKGVRRGLWVKLQKLDDDLPQHLWVRDVIQTSARHQGHEAELSEESSGSMFGARQTWGVKVALDKPAEGFGVDIGRPATIRRTAAAVVTAFVVLGLECLRALFVILGVKKVVALGSATTAGGIEQAIVLSWIFLTYFWATASRYLTAGLGLLLMLIFYGLASWWLLLAVPLLVLGMLAKMAGRWAIVWTHSLENLRVLRDNLRIIRQEHHTQRNKERERRLCNNDSGISVYSDSTNSSMESLPLAQPTTAAHWDMQSPSETNLTFSDSEAGY